MLFGFAWRRLSISCRWRVCCFNCSSRPSTALVSCHSSVVTCQLSGHWRCRTILCPRRRFIMPGLFRAAFYRVEEACILFLFVSSVDDVSSLRPTIPLVLTRTSFGGFSLESRGGKWDTEGSFRFPTQYGQIAPS
jgi:hypothetical protein